MTSPNTDRDHSSRVRGIAAAVVRTASDYWWVWLVTGTVWLIISIIILQFDRSSAMTIGVIAAVVFMGGSIQSFAIARKVEGASWLWHVFGVLLAVGSVTSFVYPGKTFAIMSAIIGAIFVLTGIFWVMKAFAVRGSDDIWWLGAAAGVIVFAMGVWLGGQFITVRAVTLSVFTGVWAAVRGVLDLAKAFQMRRLHERGLLNGP
jgi:uncharacterized membrane protein HdeD (DUF308 family)